MRFADALLVLIALGLGVWAVLALTRAALRHGKDRTWRVEQHTNADGSIVVQVRRAGEAPKLIGQPIRESDAMDTAATLRIYREDAELVARELNRKGH